MKKLTLLFLLIITFTASAQKYKYHAMTSEGVTVKAEGFIEVTDSLLVITNNYNGNITKNDYDIINIRNNKTYISDGIETHFYRIENKPGKKKGKPYSSVLFLYMRIQSVEYVISYYLSEN